MERPDCAPYTCRKRGEKVAPVHSGFNMHSGLIRTPEPHMAVHLRRRPAPAPGAGALRMVKLPLSLCMCMSISIGECSHAWCAVLVYKL